MPYRLAPCDLGNPCWADPWFPHVVGLVILMFFSLFSAAMPCRDDTMFVGLVALPCVWDQPSTPWSTCCCGALRFLTEVFIFVIYPDSPRTLLSYTLATLVECVTFSTLVLVYPPDVLSFLLSFCFLSLCCHAP